MHRRELGGSIDDVRYLESHAAADDAFRLIVAMLRALLGPLLLPPRGGRLCFTVRRFTCSVRY